MNTEEEIKQIKDQLTDLQAKSNLLYEKLDEIEMQNINEQISRCLDEVSKTQFIIDIYRPKEFYVETEDYTVTVKLHNYKPITNKDD